MQRVRSSILILGLLAVAFLNLQIGFIRFHKGMGHPVGANAVAIVMADSDSNKPVVPIRKFVSNELKATDQQVNVYLQYSYEDHEMIKFSRSVLVVISATFILYLGTFVLARLLPKRA